MRTYIGTLVTLYTVLYVPYRYERLYTTLLKCGGSVLPCTIYGIMLYKIGYFQQVSSLCVDGANQLLHESGSVVSLAFIVSQFCPSGVYSQFLVLTATINSSIVLVYYVLTLLGV